MIKTIEYQPIGLIHSPFENKQDMPIQPCGANGIFGQVEIFEEFAQGLNDLEGFSHIILLFFFHKSQGFKLQVTPFMDTQLRGVFATRAPKRPNPLGLSIVKLCSRNQNILKIENVDILNKTPLLDIKPYVPDFDPQTNIRVGWLEKVRQRAEYQKSDDRFK